MKQKFSALSFVRVKKSKDPTRLHFEGNFLAIVEGTYSQLYGGRNIFDYSLYVLDDGKIVNTVAWYPEKDLVLLARQSRKRAEAMVEKWNFRSP